MQEKQGILGGEKNNMVKSQPKKGEELDISLYNLIFNEKYIENNIKNSFDNYLENFLQSIEGYKDLNNDQKAIAKIFTCISILYKMKK